MQAMHRREYLLFRSEMRTRNKALEYFMDWLTMSHPRAGQTNSTNTTELQAAFRYVAIYPSYMSTTLFSDLDVACMSAAAAVLVNLPLQVDNAEQRDMLDAKSRLFQRYKNAER
jgi:hypothetical protein